MRYNVFGLFGTQKEFKTLKKAKEYAKDTDRIILKVNNG